VFLSEKIKRKGEREREGEGERERGREAEIGREEVRIYSSATSAPPRCQPGAKDTEIF
jgi:hypothetical protein